MTGETTTHSLVVDVREGGLLVALLLEKFREGTEQVARLVERAGPKFDSEARYQWLVLVQAAVHTIVVDADSLVSPLLCARIRVSPLLLGQ